MNNRILRILTTIFASLAILVGFGPGHSLLMSQLGAHGLHISSAASQCQLVCAPINLDKIAQKDNIKEPNEPDAYFYQNYSVLINSEIAIIVALLASVLAFLRARPPDLLAQYSLLRI